MNLSGVLTALGEQIRHCLVSIDSLFYIY